VSDIGHKFGDVGEDAEHQSSADVPVFAWKIDPSFDPGENADSEGSLQHCPGAVNSYWQELKLTAVAVYD
jgi:hypothetical protein